MFTNVSKSECQEGAFDVIHHFRKPRSLFAKMKIKHDVLPAFSLKGNVEFLIYKDTDNDEMFN